MKDIQLQNDQGAPEDNKRNKNGFIQPLPHEGSRENDRAKLNKADAGGTGLGPRKDHGKQDREIRKQ